MEVYTIQLAQWRKCKTLGIPLLDTTAKSGDPVFAPGRGIVNGIKYGGLTEEEYTSEYLKQMRLSYVENPSRWNEVMEMDTVAFACYCGPEKFCHRHLLVDIYRKLCRHRGVPFVLKGEIRL